MADDNGRMGKFLRHGAGFDHCSITRGGACFQPAKRAHLQAVGKQLNCEVKAGQGQADGHEIEIIANKNDPAGAAMLDLFKSLNWPASLEQSGGQKGEIQVFIPQKSP